VVAVALTESRSPATSYEPRRELQPVFPVTKPSSPKARVDGVESTAGRWPPESAYETSAHVVAASDGHQPGHDPDDGIGGSTPLPDAMMGAMDGEAHDDLLSSGDVRPIVRYGDPALHSACAPVEHLDDDLRRLVADMFATMAAADGVGLAANQVGVGLRVFVVDCPDADGRRVVAHVVNPELEVPEREGRVLDVSDEGCLSLPGPYAELARPDQAVVSGVDVDGAPVRIEGTGLLSRCLQHESDHLEGVVFVDRLPQRARKRVLADVADP
jgi:peptide deformylase